MTHVFLPPVLLQIADDLGNEKFCIDASQSGAGNWLKYIRVACSCDEQNLAVCHINDQVMTLAISELLRSPVRAAQRTERGGSAEWKRLRRSAMQRLCCRAAARAFQNPRCRPGLGSSRGGEGCVKC